MSHLASILLGGSDDGFRAEQNHGEIGSCNSKDPHELTTLGLLNDVETNWLWPIRHGLEKGFEDHKDI